MWPAQTAPVVPDPGALKDLNPVVATAFLVVVIVLALLFYFGNVLRDRMSGKKPDPAPPSAAATAPVATSAVDRTAEVTDRLIANLERRIEQLEREVKELRADNEEMARQLARRRPGY